MEETSDVIPVWLIHRIQSFLPVKEAARTCILSKSWLHEWSTIPTLRFSLQIQEEKTRKYYDNLINHIDRTLLRYHHDNIPIEAFHLQFINTNCPCYNTSSLVENWVRQLVSKGKRSSCLKKLSLIIIDRYCWSFTLPDELFYGNENVSLKIIKLRASSLTPLRIIGSNANNNIPTCVSLHVLELAYVDIGDDVLDKLLSTCTLLEKIRLFLCEGFDTIKVKNLPCLRELRVCLKKENHLLEIDQVPRLGFFRCNHEFIKPLPFNTNSLGSVTRLHVSNIIVDDVFLDMIQFKLPFLESLAIEFVGSSFYRLQEVITSFSLKRLEIMWRVYNHNWPHDEKIDLQVYAPKLSSFVYYGSEPIHRLLFQNVAPRKINLSFSVENQIDHSFFLKMKEILKLSTNFDIEIIGYDHDSSLRKTNVKQLSHITCLDERVWENTGFFDTLFSICDPLNVKAQQDTSNENKCYSNIVVTAKKTTDLKDGGINFCNGDLPFIEFKLTWPSHL